MSLALAGGLLTTVPPGKSPDFNFDNTGIYWRQIPSKIYISKERAVPLRFKAATMADCNVGYKCPSTVF